MNDPQTILTVSLLAAAIFAPLLIRLGSYGVVSWWKRRFVQRVILMGFLLRDVRERLSKSEQGTQHYSSGDPEPYGDTARELHRVLSEAQREYSAQVQRRSQLLRRVPDPPTDWPSLLLFGFWPEPNLWYHLYVDTEALLVSTQDLQTAGVYAGQVLEDLRRKPVEVAGRIKNLRKTDDKIVQVVQALSEAKFHGEAFESATTAIQALRARLNSLPSWFYQEPAQLVLKRSLEKIETTKETTIQAWKTLEEIESPIRERFEELQHWQSKHREVGRLIQIMNQATEIAQQHLRKVPSSIDASSLANDVWQASTEAKQVEEQYRVPTANILNNLSERAQSITQTSSHLTKRADHIKQQFDRLRQVIALNAESLKQSTSKMDEIACEEEYPLHWQQSEAEMAQIREVEGAIGAVEIQRTPSQLEKHIAMANELRGRIQVLEQTIGTVRAQRDQIISLLKKPELAVGLRLDQVRTLYRNATEYALENWSANDAVATILTEGDVLAKRQRELIPSVNTRLQEQQIAQQLNGLQVLATRLSEFQARLRRIEDTLKSLQRREEEARQKLTSTQQALERLKTTDATLSSLLEKGESLASEFRQRATGRVLKKAKVVDNWANDCKNTLTALKKAIQRRVDEIEKQLREKVRQLREVASFSQEQAMVDAEQLVMVEYAFEMPIAISNQTRVEQLVSQINELSERRESLTRSGNEIKAKIETPITGYIERLREANEEASKKYKELTKVHETAKANWPPITCNLRTIERQWKRAKQYADQLKKSGTTLAYVLSHIDSLIERYEEIADRVDEKLTEIRAKQRTLQDVQDRIDYWKKHLEGYRRENYQDAAIGKAVRDQLAKIETKLTEARTDYMSGRLSYEAVEHRLKEIWEIAYQPLYIDRGHTVQTISVGDISATGSVTIQQSIHQQTSPQLGGFGTGPFPFSGNQFPWSSFGDR